MFDLKKYYEEDGITFISNSRTSKVSKSSGSIILETNKGEKIKVEEIAKIINGNESKVEKEILAPVGKIFSKKFRKSVHENDRKFNVDENCNSCGVCEKVCPVNNIIMVEDKPQWQHNCQRCLACIQLCSQKAIQWKEKTAHKDRYRHPEITVKDIINQK